MGKAHPRGSSLLETVIGLFVLTGSLIVFFTLFHSSLGTQTQIENQKEALAIALERMEELKISALDREAFADGLSAEVGTRAAANNSVFEVQTEVESVPDFYSPSRDFEATFSGTPFPDVHNGLVTDDRKNLPNSMLAVRVTVRFSGSLAKPVILTSYLREPRRELGEVQIRRRGPLTISYQERTHFEATAFDTDGEEITDIVFHWQIEPITGYGTLYPSRNGRIATLEFVDYDVNGNPFQPPIGTCQVSATAIVAGIAMTKKSEEITLTP